MADLAVALVLLGWILYRQLTTRPLKSKSPAGWILLGLGLVSAAQFAGSQPLTAIDAGVVLGSAAIGSGLAFLRAQTVRLWVQDQSVMRRGTWLTAALWVAGLGQHLLLDAVVRTPGLAQATMTAYLGLVLLVQRQALVARVRHAAIGRGDGLQCASERLA